MPKGVYGRLSRFRMAKGGGNYAKSDIAKRAELVFNFPTQAALAAD